MLRRLIIKVSVLANNLGYFPLLVEERVPMEQVPIFLSKRSRSSFPFIILYPFLSAFPFPFHERIPAGTETTPDTVHINDYINQFNVNNITIL